MAAPCRHVVSIEDLPTATLLTLLDLAESIDADKAARGGALSGQLAATLFLEPSTRTRLSFEAAVQRLGGGVISVADPRSSSLSKGESLEDTVRTVDAYADVLILRHPEAGAARRAAEVASHPVINAGDGSGEHPSQTLCDLFVLRRLHGRLENLTLLFYGDLRYGRTVHSLCRALSRFGGRMICVAEEGLEVPTEVEEDLAERVGAAVAPVRLTGLGEVFPEAGLRARVIARPAALPAADSELSLEQGGIDALYVTRLQTERLAADASRSYGLPLVDRRFLAAAPFQRAAVMHPLPRVHEIATEVDGDPRAAWFRQVAAGVPVRMALLLWCLGRA